MDPNFLLKASEEHPLLLSLALLFVSSFSRQVYSGPVNLNNSLVSFPIVFRRCLYFLRDLHPCLNLSRFPSDALVNALAVSVPFVMFICLLPQVDVQRAIESSLFSTAVICHELFSRELNSRLRVLERIEARDR